MAGLSQSQARGARILLVDNYSSFTYNLYQYLAELSGVEPMVVRNDALAAEDIDALLVEIDGVVLSPGPGHPARARDFGICRDLLDRAAMPILGVCLGHEGLGHHHGATIERATEAYHGRSSVVRHQGDELFAGLPSEFKAVRYHSLAVAEPLPASLRAIARTEQGELMALRHLRYPHWGVQFHPESAETEYGKQLLANFCQLSQASRRGSAARAERQAPAPLRPSGPEPRRWRLLRRELGTKRSCAELFRRLYANSETAFWLDGESDESCSYIGDAGGPHGYVLSYSLESAAVELRGARSGVYPCESIFAYLEQELANNAVCAQGVVQGDQLPGAFAGGFAGGFVGYFGYELKAECGASNQQVSAWPDAHWIFCDRFLQVDHATGTCFALALVPEDESRGDSERAPERAPEQVPGQVPGRGSERGEGQSLRWFDELANLLAQDARLVANRPELVPSSEPMASRSAPIWRDERARYLQMIESCRQEILAGESYELCLTSSARIDEAVDALCLFDDMRTSNPAPYSAFLRCAGFSLASSSPERFLKIDAAGRVESKPIKGTCARSSDPVRDAALAETLQTSAKERAENLMIVDLVRNDLGRSCQVGSVRVDTFAALESYASVHQLVSTISGRLLAERSPLSCVRAAFPGGSMTGAPKLRSMEILDGLESAARGPYSGSLGYLGLDGAVDLSIVIRTALIADASVSVGVGGAITALSEAEAEHDEIVLKASAALAAIGRMPRRES